MSGYSTEDARHVLADEQATTFLQKPFRPADLTAVLRSLLAAA
jgi:DNA-binding response OmpR family regulator